MTTDPDDELSALEREIAQPGADDSERPSDPIGMFAIILGCIGLVTFGFVLAIVTALVATIAGQQAMRQKRSLDNAYIAFGLAVLDAVVFLVLHFLFRLPAFAG
jgi:hypothetical protein